jgi:multiple sugar transport system substrate-binding protein
MWQPMKFPVRKRDSSGHRFTQMFRTLSFGCIAVLLIGILAACGGQGSSSSSSSSSNGKITITEMDYWSIPAQVQTVQELFKEYEQLHPNVTIQRVQVPFANLIPKADQEAASHTLPNLLMLDNPSVAQFASTGALLPLDSFMKGSFSQSDFYAGPYTTMLYQGKVYAMPVGSNDLGIFYNIKMFKAANLQPPQTWDDLVKDAKLLKHGDTYGIAFSVPADEEATWQLEPFLWTDGGDLAKIDSPQGLDSLQMMVNMVRDGSASRAVLTWGQPDVGIQFYEGHAAMMENGPWEIPAVEQQGHMKYGVDYGIVPFPVPHAGMKPVVPLGGETWTIPVSDQAHEQATWDLVNWLEQPTQLVKLDKQFDYIPAIKSAAQILLQQEPYMQVFANEFDTARARTATLGAKYPQVSQVVWTAIQDAISGRLSTQAALAQAQQKITPIVNSSS